ncbi:MAG TPA: hypothetical protein VNE16_11440 [Vicinamibacterales bacterium]|nr:hypothetical protein [Vicinamibacterales bacterium]
MDALAEIKRLYYQASRSTITRDLARAVELLKSLPDEEARERAAVYMDGLSQMRSEWGGHEPSANRRPPRRLPGGSSRR